MPIYEYVCRECNRRFEALVMGSRQPECTQCNSTKLDPQISSFSVGAAARQGSCSSAMPNGRCASSGGT
jgi:putative FmdB family regulatory protein